MAADATARRVRKVLVTFAHPDDAKFAVRSMRKKLSGICLFLVLAALIMGLWATFFFNFYLALALVAVAAIYAWKVYRKPVPLDWI